VSTEISTTHEEDGLISEIEAIANTNNFNGVILITQGNKVITEIARGKSDLSAKNALIPTDQFVIGSISKQITAVLILREMEKGNLALSDKIGKFLPEIKQEWAQNVSIHHLLSHTHGIASLDKPAEFSPGSQFQYSQIGYDLLAQIITVVSNKSFEDAAMELFETKGMNQTFHPDRKGYTRLVKGYEELEDLSLEYQTTSLSNFAAAGSFISTAHDLWLWNQLLYSGQLVHLETLELMRTKQAVREHPIFSQVNYGYGLLFMENEANIEIGALGYAPGFASACYYYPKTDMHVVVLSNIARDLNEFKLTFETHTSIMRLVKEISL
jgi:CubicO group peptidase (beta-lactamase class C family)